MKYILGIDPGLSGALALYDPEKPHVAVMDMPTLTIETNGKKRKRVDLYQLAQFFDMWAGEISQAIIEDPRSMPNDGAVQAFKFGHCCGVVQAMTAAHFIPMSLPSPRLWKQRMRLTADKDASRLLASQTLPAFAGQWPLVKHDGRAEAVLLAVYGARFV